MKNYELDDAVLSKDDIPIDEEIEGYLAPFEWDRMRSGGYIIRSVKDKNATRIEIPYGVAILAENACRDMKSLREIVFTPSLIWIDRNALRGCSALTELEIPDTVTRIGRDALRDCSSLTKITLPFLGGGDRFVTKYYDPEDKDHYRDFATHIAYVFGVDRWLSADSAPGDAVYHYGARSKESYYVKHRLPKSLKTVVQGKGCNLWSGEGLAGCRYIEEVCLRPGEERLSPTTFFGCPSLKRIVRSGGDSDSQGEFAPFISTGYKKSLLVYPEGMMPKDGDLSIPSNAGAVGMLTFYQQEGLYTVRIPEGVKEIGSSAFSGCKNLTQLYLPASLNRIDSSAFSGCPVRQIYFTGTKKEFKAITVGTFNDCLKKAKKVFKYKPE